MIKITIESEKLTNKQKEFLLWFLLFLMILSSTTLTWTFFRFMNDSLFIVNLIIGVFALLMWIMSAIMGYFFLLGYGLIKTKRKRK